MDAGSSGGAVPRKRMQPSHDSEKPGIFFARFRFLNPAPSLG